MKLINYLKEKSSKIVHFKPVNKHLLILKICLIVFLLSLATFYLWNNISKNKIQQNNNLISSNIQNTINKLLELKDNDIIKIRFTHENIYNNQIIKEEKVLTLEVARSPEKRTKGLMFRKYLNNIDGMIFIFDEKKIQNFWMKNTFIPLDIIFLDDDLTIINIYENTLVNNDKIIYSSTKPCRFVIELKAGSIKNLYINNKTKFHI
ncbi:MAG: DUF192 domain-containing protein [Candidatus Dojkabacteria bacterium]|nr:DUF192 domain-containing protein [Candidatus Dojkabacteria bacterium]